MQKHQPMQVFHLISVLVMPQIPQLTRLDLNSNLPVPWTGFTNIILFIGVRCVLTFFEESLYQGYW